MAENSDENFEGGFSSHDTKRVSHDEDAFKAQLINFMETFQQLAKHPKIQEFLQGPTQVVFSIPLEKEDSHAKGSHDNCSYGRATAGGVKTPSKSTGSKDFVVFGHEISHEQRPYDAKERAHVGVQGAGGRVAGDGWGIEASAAQGALMVLTLKVVSAAINYQDGLLKEEDLRPAQKENRLVVLPSVAEYVGYCLCCGTHLAGPVYEMKDYLDWTADKGLWSPSQKPPSPYGGALIAFLQALLCMGLHTTLAPHFPVSRVFEPQFNEWGFWKRWGYEWLVGFSVRWKYYFIWSISESAVIISGLGFSGWSESQPIKPKWDRAINVDIIGVELAESSAVLPLVWNIHVSTWLRVYVYERLRRKGRKGGLFELLATQIVSAVWHGLYAGYILFFINSALMIAGSRVIYRWQQAVPEDSWVLNKIFWFIGFFFTTFGLNYACIGFIVLDLHQTLKSFSSLYFAGSLIPLGLIIFGTLVKPPRSVRAKAKKA
ncbi:hypothetical protein L7F22_013301 [Adiantum nelumboides]|nr:hypothetical protein [Adiantum nelumboides]